LHVYVLVTGYPMAGPTLVDAEPNARPGRGAQCKT